MSTQPPLVLDTLREQVNAIRLNLIGHGFVNRCPNCKTVPYSAECASCARNRAVLAGKAQEES